VQARRLEAPGHWASGAGERQKATDIASLKTERCRAQRSARATSCSCKRATRFPGDGEVIEGVASVNESAVTGESAPVIREAGGDRSSVVGGTQVLSDWLIVRIAADPGSSFLDRMIAMVEGAKRQKTPNEIALDILLAALTITSCWRAPRCCRTRSTR
jgi:high-affinity K+ transport system ATPase subunit B